MPPTKKGLPPKPTSALAGYGNLLADVVQVIESARRAAARSVNAIMTVTYWLVGQRVVETEQKGALRAAYGEGLLERLSVDSIARFWKRLLPAEPPADACVLPRVCVRQDSPDGVWRIPGGAIEAHATGAVELLGGTPSGVPPPTPNAEQK